MRRTRERLLAIGALVAGLLLANGAAAQLSEVDLIPGSGDAKATFDAATGLYWLDLPETTTLSVPDVLGGAGGWVPDGWRYATPSEICALFAAYALAVESCGGIQGGQAEGNLVGTLQGFLGLTSGDPQSPFTGGFWDDHGDPARAGIARLLYQSAIDTSASLVQGNATFATALPNFGSWLVRDDPPAPAVPALSWPLGGVLLLLGVVLVASRLDRGVLLS
jgi:hypothetical protein